MLSGILTDQDKLSNAPSIQRGGSSDVLQHNGQQACIVRTIAVILHAVCIVRTIAIALHAVFNTKLRDSKTNAHIKGRGETFSFRSSPHPCCKFAVIASAII